MATTQSKFGRRFDEEFKREVAALASRPGASDTQVAHDLGVSPYSVGRWKKLYGHAPAASSAPGVSVPELERRIKALERENADLREQRTILKKSSRHLLRTPAMKIGVIRSLAGQHPVRKLCRTLGVARSAYYAAQKKEKRPRAQDNVRLGGKARGLFEASGRTYGSPRLTVALRREGERCGRHRVARLMRQAGLRAKQKRRCRPGTTDSHPLYPIAPNHLAERAEPPARPGEVWQADITYVATQEGWLYVAGVLDAYSRKIVGWAADAAMPTGLVMSRAGNCYDNARMESFWATLKGELIGDHVFATRAEAKSAIFHYIEVFYNRVRLHSALGFYSPVDFEHQLN